MNRVAACCDTSIHRFLEGTLSELATNHLEQHLEQCSRCNDQLAKLSAAPQFWDESKSFLQSVECLPDLEAADDTSIFEDAESVESVQLALRDIPLQPTDDPTKLGRFGGYEITGIVGRGGMGIVLKGWDRSLDRFVAIKVLSPTYAHQSAARQRFAREAKAAAAIVHDNIVPIFGVDHCNGLPYRVMPYLKGESLQTRIDREAPLTLEEMLEVALQIARGLQAAHDQGVIHRDIKPANILLPQSVSRIVITDFGLARAADDAALTCSGIIAGTPAFMSPEQARGDPIDTRSDLFSLGSVMFAMACGHPPFRADSAYGIMRRIIDVPHRELRQLRSDLPHWFQQIVDQLLAKQRAQRFATAAELAEHLESCLIHLRQPGQQPLPTLKRVRARKRCTLMTLSVVSLCCATLAGWLMKNTNSSNPITNPDVEFSTIDMEIDRDLEQLDTHLQQLEQELDE